MKIIAAVNQKGGVGKTSLTLNLGFELSKAGYKILIIDLDPQASLSKNLIGEDELQNYKGIEELFLSDKAQPSECIVSLNQENLFILPCQQRACERKREDPPRLLELFRAQGDSRKDYRLRLRSHRYSAFSRDSYAQ